MQKLFSQHNNEPRALANSLLEHEILTGSQINALFIIMNSQKQLEQRVESNSSSQSVHVPLSPPSTTSSASITVAAGTKSKDVAPIGSRYNYRGYTRKVAI